MLFKNCLSICDWENKDMDKIFPNGIIKWNRELMLIIQDISLSFHL